jgi:hypothetical protein
MATAVSIAESLADSINSSMSPSPDDSSNNNIIAPVAPANADIPMTINKDINNHSNLLNLPQISPSSAQSLPYDSIINGSTIPTNLSNKNQYFAPMFSASPEALNQYLKQFQPKLEANPNALTNSPNNKAAITNPSSNTILSSPPPLQNPNYIPMILNGQAFASANSNQSSATATNTGTAPISYQSIVYPQYVPLFLPNTTIGEKGGITPQQLQMYYSQMLNQNVPTTINHANPPTNPSNNTAPATATNNSFAPRNKSAITSSTSSPAPTPPAAARSLGSSSHPQKRKCSSSNRALLPKTSAGTASQQWLLNALYQATQKNAAKSLGNNVNNGGNAPHNNAVETKAMMEEEENHEENEENSDEEGESGEENSSAKRRKDSKGGGASGAEEGRSSSSGPRASKMVLSDMLDGFSSQPLTTLYCTAEQQFTMKRDKSKKLAVKEKDQVVRVPVRVMGEYKLASIYFVAKDVCPLVSLRKGSIAKTIHDFIPDFERSRMPIHCSRSNGSGCIQILTVLTVAGVQRMKEQCRKVRGKQAIDELLNQVEALCKEGAIPVHPTYAEHNRQLIESFDPALGEQLIYDHFETMVTQNPSHPNIHMLAKKIQQLKTGTVPNHSYTHANHHAHTSLNQAKEKQAAQSLSQHKNGQFYSGMDLEMNVDLGATTSSASTSATNSANPTPRAKGRRNSGSRARSHSINGDLPLIAMAPNHSRPNAGNNGQASNLSSLMLLGIAASDPKVKRNSFSAAGLANLSDFLRFPTVSPFGSSSTASTSPSPLSNPAVVPLSSASPALLRATKAAAANILSSQPTSNLKLENLSSRVAATAAANRLMLNTSLEGQNPGNNGGNHNHNHNHQAASPSPQPPLCISPMPRLSSTNSDFSLNLDTAFKFNSLRDLSASPKSGGNHFGSTSNFGSSSISISNIPNLTSAPDFSLSMSSLPSLSPDIIPTLNTALGMRDISQPAFNNTMNSTTSLPLVKE